MQARKMLFAAILSICALSSKKISIYSLQLSYSYLVLNSITGDPFDVIGVFLQGVESRGHSPLPQSLHEKNSVSSTNLSIPAGTHLQDLVTNNNFLLNSMFTSEEVVNAVQTMPLGEQVTLPHQGPASSPNPPSPSFFLINPPSPAEEPSLISSGSVSQTELFNNLSPGEGAPSHRSEVGNLLSAPEIRDPATGKLILQAPSPGARVDVFDVPGTPSSPFVPNDNSRLFELQQVLGESSLQAPLLYEEQRRCELTNEMSRMVSIGLLDRMDPKMLESQLQLEMKLESALRANGYTAESIFHSRGQRRRAAFTTDTRGTFISHQGLMNTLTKYANKIDASLNYKRILKGVEWGTVHLKKTES